MALDWLYGPRTAKQDAYGSVTLRSLVLDVDTLLDVQATMNRRMPRSALGARFTVSPEPDVPAAGRDVTPDELRAMGQYERRRLTLAITEEDEDGGTHQIIASFHSGTPSVYADRPFWPARDEIARHLLAEGHPRVVWSNLVRLLPLLPGLVLVGLFIWAEATTHMVPAIHFLGWFVVLLAGVYGVRALVVSGRQPTAPIGHVIRPESRSDTAARRADTKRDFKVALWTFLPSITLALATAWLTDFFGLGR